MRIGAHISIAGGLENAPLRAARLGCSCFQIFLTNPQQWELRKTNPDEIAAFRSACREQDLSPVVVHLSYLPNLATPYKDHALRAKDSFFNQYRMARDLGATFFVLHPGSSRGGSHASAATRVAQSLREAVREVPDGPVLLLENTVGSGSTLGVRPEELGDIAKNARLGDRLGVCFDTAHACAAGTELWTEGAIPALCGRYRDAFGYDPIRLLHVNDLLTRPGGCVDRHAHLGKGTLGEVALRHILTAKAFSAVPRILETPVEDGYGHAENLAVLRAYSGEPACPSSLHEPGSSSS